MTRHDMTDEQVRAELERLDPYFAHDWDEHKKCDEIPHGCPTIDALRLLAESQQALGEIVKRTELIFKIFRIESVRKRDLFPKIEDINKIARTYLKGGK